MKKISILLMIIILFIPTIGFAKESHLPSGMEESDVETVVDQIMEQYIGEEKDIPGLGIVIVKDNQVLLEKGYGFADIERQLKVDPERTVFEAASISKVFTWSAIMQLVEEGKIDLDQNIQAYLPDDYLNLQYANDIRILDLMNHTAGFEDTTEQLLVTNPDKIIPLYDYLSKEHGQPRQVFEPGTTTAYSNYGASLAGLIIENVSSNSFEDYMNTNILDKLHMDYSTFTTDYSQLPKIVDHKSKGYIKSNDGFEEVDWAYVNDAPAGALNTTIHDMAHFMMAHLDSADYSLFERKETLEAMHKQSSNFTENAHGFWERSINGMRILEHGGNSTGFTTQLTLVPEENLGIAVLMNAGEEMSQIRVDLIEALIGKQENPDSIAVSPNDHEVVGTYRSARGIYTNFLKVLSIVSGGDVTIKEDPSGGITLQTSVDPEPIHYVETDHLLYERMDDVTPLMDKAGMDTSKVKFERDEKSNQMKLTFGVVTDYLKLDWKDRADFNLGLIIISLFIYFSFLATHAIQWIRHKRRKINLPTNFRLTSILSGVSLLVVTNIVLLFYRFIQDPFQELSPLRIHLLINYLLPVSLIIYGYFVIKQWHEQTNFQKTARILLLCVTVLFTLFLFNFNLLKL